MKFSGQSYSNLLFLVPLHADNTPKKKFGSSNQTRLVTWVEVIRRKFSILMLMIQIPLAETNVIFLSSGETERLLE